MLKQAALPLLMVPLLIMSFVACASSSQQGSPMPSPPSAPPATVAPRSPSGEPRQGVLGLVADLVDAGADAQPSDSFNGEPLALDGTLVCVEGEALRVYSYGIPEEAATAAARIDPDDPSNVGTAIVEWVGEPNFWLRDRVIIVYSGDDEQLTSLLTNLLGEPFASGTGTPALLPDGC